LHQHMVRASLTRHAIVCFAAESTLVPVAAAIPGYDI